MPETEPTIMVLVPCYQESANIGRVVAETRALGLDTIAIDDGSADGTTREAKKAGAVILRHETNRGKGAAVATGLQYALKRDVDAVILIDGDGQHLPSEIPRFVEAFRTTQADLIIGSRMANTRTMPFLRRQTNRFMSRLLSLQIGQRVSDTQCGFRLLSRRAIPAALDCTSGGFSAESEILLQLALRGYVFAEVPISTIYGDETSKIRPIHDTLRFAKMLLHFRQQRRAFKQTNSSPSTPD